MTALIDIVNGKHDTFHIVQRLAESINLEELGSCDAETLGWFSAGELQP